MYYAYGSHTHDDGECTATITREGLVSDCGKPYGYRERWELRGRLQADTQAELSAAIGTLEAAYERHGKDMGLYDDDGAVTSHLLDSSASRGGTRVVRRPFYPDGRGAEYSIFRNYVVVVEADFLDNQFDLLSWAETIRAWGGGPRFVLLECLTGPPQKQLVQEQTTYDAIQTGRAIGNDTYPVPPAPLWPAEEHSDQRDIHREVPSDNSGRKIIVWAYTFESIAPLVGLPRVSEVN